MTVALVREPFTLLDGGLSTALEQLGHHPTGLLWTAGLLVDRPAVLVDAHRLAVEAGADVVITASYQASEAGLVRAGLSPADARTALASTTALARRAGAALVAASIGPYGATLGDGSEYHGRYDATWSDVRAFHRRRLAVLVDTGPDVLAVETIPGRIEAEIVVEEGIALTSTPMWVTFSCRDATTTCAGDDIATAFAAVDHPQVVAVGVNCTPPRLVADLLRHGDDARPLVAYPNHGGRWDPFTERWHDAEPGVTLVDLAPAWVASGARLVGGCCGVGPDEIARLASARDRWPGSSP
jgi:homocysteine S-methyltransferase